MKVYKDPNEFVMMNDYLLRARKDWAETVYLDEELLRDAITFYNEYFGYKEKAITKEEALSYADLGARLNADLWKSMMPMNEEKMKMFYNITPFYFFHDIVRFMDGIHREIAINLLNKAKPPILDFAGGTGGLSFFLSSKGWDVTYCDTSQLQCSFVEWYSNRKSLNIKVVRDISELKPKSFNFIIAKDIAEHVLDPGELCYFLTSLLANEGKISLTEIPCCGPEELAPMHFKVESEGGDIRWNLEDNIKLLGRNRNEIISSNPMPGSE